MSDCLSYYLSGSISDDTEIYIVAEDNNRYPYFLTLSKNETTNMEDLVFDPRINSTTLIPINTPLTLTLRTAVKALQLQFVNTDNLNKGVSTITTNNNTIAVVGNNSETLMNVNHNLCTDLILVGTNYNIFSRSNKIVSWKAYVPDLTSVENSVVTQIASPLNIQNNFFTSIRLLPKTWYDQSDGGCTTTVTGNDVLSTEVKWIIGQTVTKGFASKGECQTAFVFTPCPSGLFCGDNNCRGVCQNSGEICAFDAENKTYFCRSDKNETLSGFIEESCGFQWLIILILTILIIVLIVSKFS